MRESVGRILCVGLGALYMAGLVSLFGFGEVGDQLWSAFRGQIDGLAQSVGVSSWVIVLLLAPFLIGGPLALVWRLAGGGISRIFWLLVGVALVLVLVDLRTLRPSRARPMPFPETPCGRSGPSPTAETDQRIAWLSSGLTGNRPIRQGRSQ